MKNNQNDKNPDAVQNHGEDDAVHNLDSNEHDDDDRDYKCCDNFFKHGAPMICCDNFDEYAIEYFGTLENAEKEWKSACEVKEWKTAGEEDELDNDYLENGTWEFHYLDDEGNIKTYKVTKEERDKVEEEVGFFGSVYVVNH